MSCRPSLSRAFFDRSVHLVAPDLIGCRVFHGNTGGVIVETEAYEREDPASHAYRGLTERNRALFGPPGRAYVYFTYGMHFMLNIVCEENGRAAGVLIRALEPVSGIEEMRRRRAPVRELHQLTNGPAKLTRALGIDMSLYETPVYRGGKLRVCGRTAAWQEPVVVATPRIGIRVGTRRKWRYVAAGSKFLSRRLSGDANDHVPGKTGRPVSSGTLEGCHSERSEESDFAG